jgi:hypothetical protein
MPLNPLENMPASLARHYAFSNYHIQNPIEEKMHERAKESMLEGYPKLSCETGHLLSSPNYNISNSLKQEKVGISDYHTMPHIQLFYILHSLWKFIFLHTWRN